MTSRHRLLPVIVGGLCFALLPLGGGALGATSSGANGDIAFARSGSIYLKSTGSVLVPGVDPSWSPDGKKLAFAATSGGPIETCTVSSCTATAAQVGLLTGSEPVWSPDATTLAYVSAANIHIVVLSGVSDSTLVAGADPSWSADGTKIAFAQGGAIYTCAVSSCGSPTQIVATGTQPAWSPDGSTIAYQATSNGHTHIFVIPAGGGTATAITPTSSDDETAPSWSPDGTSVVYADSAHGLESVTQGSGGTWATPVVEETNTSDATPDWQTVAPIVISAPSISGAGSPETGQLLSTTNGSWSGASSTGFTYQWQRCDSSGGSCSSIGGATSSTYAVVSDDIGHTLRSLVTASNSAGSTTSSPSSATGVVTQAGVVKPPLNTAYPTITLPFGETAPQTGDTVFASAGTWTGSFPFTFTYHWKRCDGADPLNGDCYTIPDATSSSYTIPGSLYGMRLRVSVTAMSSQASVTQDSVASGVITAFPPHLHTTPPVVGNNVVDQTLTVTSGVWFGSQPMTFTYEWRRCDPQGDLPTCVAIPGATTTTYVPTLADIGFSLVVYITATNPAGSVVGTTVHTYPVIDKPHFAPSTRTPPSITGSLVVGRKLTADAGSYAGDLPIATTLVWQRCDATGAACRDIPRATKSTYSTTRTDVGYTLRVFVVATNAYGAITALSDPSDPVLGLPAHCRGRTIVAPRGDNFIVGTRCDDVIRSGAGNDTINGAGGYDTIYGGGGHDVITVPGPGNSRIVTGNGSDTLYAVNGYPDTIVCGTGHDKVFADPIDVVKNCAIVVRRSPGAPASP